MSFHKINSYTWVINDGKKSLQEKERLISEKSLAKGTNYLKERKYRRPIDQNNNYIKFINKIFQDRSFISQREFHELVKASFNSSPTWYRRRMIELGLITQNNKLIKPLP